MARVFINGRPDTKHLYSVDNSVGLGCPNKRDDVLLVQFFLKVATLSVPTSAGYNPPGEKLISVDGNCGPQTIRYIKFFQEEGNRRNPGSQTTTDNRVDPVLTGTPFGSISNKLYTIIALNLTYRERRGIMIADIKQDPFYHSDLTKSLYLD